MWNWWFSPWDLMFYELLNQWWLRGLVRLYSCRCTGIFSFPWIVALSLIIKHALSLLNHLFMSMCWNQNKDLYLFCNFSFELVPVEFLGANAFFFKPNYAANLRIKDVKTLNFLLQSQPSYIFLASTDIAL